MKSKSLTNQQVAEILREISQFRGLSGSDWGARAYAHAADIVDRLPVPAHTLSESSLQEIPRIGARLAEAIHGIAKGRPPAELEDGRAKWPPSIFTMTRIVGVGPKRAVALWEKYGVASFEALHTRVQAGTIPDENLCRAVRAAYHTTGKRIPWATAHGIIQHMLDVMRDGARIRARAVGSYRRGASDVGDIDIIFTTKYAARRKRVTELFRGLGPKIVAGDSKSSIFYRPAGGGVIRVDLLVVKPHSWGAALLYFTGSAEHNIALRNLAISKGWMLNEHGLWTRQGKLIASETESSIYHALGIVPTRPSERTGVLRTSKG